MVMAFTKITTKNRGNRREINNSLTKQWKELEIGGLNRRFSFVINDKSKFKHVWVLAVQDGVKAVYYAKCLRKNKFRKLFKTK